MRSIILLIRRIFDPSALFIFKMDTSHAQDIFFEDGLIIQALQRGGN